MTQPLGDEPPDGGGSLRPTSAPQLAVLALIALVAGWLVHYVGERVGTAPVVSVAQPALLLLFAALLGLAAWSTWRTLHVRLERLTPGQGVSRLLLARASALVGSVTAGGYLGYALSWVGSRDDLAGERGWRSAAAALAGLLVVVAGMLLERACRVRDDDPDGPGRPRGSGQAR